MTDIRIDDRPLTIPHMGFTNTGSICYFNALVQCLLSSNVFLRYVIHKQKHPFFLEFFRSIVNDQWDTIFTTRLLQLYNMVAPNQSSSEYFVFLVDLLHLEPIFEITHKFEMKCTGCGFVKFSKDTTYNPMIDQSFIEFFKTGEQLDHVKCDGCHTHQTMVRTRTIEGIPPVLAFSLNKYFAKRDISYPTLFRIDDTQYRLIGTIEHYGVLGAGHYVARYIRNGEAALADDARCTSLPSIEPTSNTYMVFYERVQ